eukprot:1756108-Pleurochrysis_carterae.AAC.1
MRLISVLIGWTRRLTRCRGAANPPRTTDPERSTRAQASHCATVDVAHGPTIPARALIAGRAKRLANPHARGTGRKGITFVVDSGCTWHIHPHLQDLVDVRPIQEFISGVDGRPQRATH